MPELIVSPGGRRYGRHADNRQHADRRNKLLAIHPGMVLPSKASTSQWMGKIRDQEQEGSCTGQLKAEIRDLIYRKLYLFEHNRDVPPNQFMASASFAYLTNLIADGDLGQDAGSSIHQTFVTLNAEGCCLESDEPYTDTNFSIPPTTVQYTEALIYKGGPYHFIPDLQTIKACIASGYSVGFGIDVYQSFESPEFAASGHMPMPSSGEQYLGGHAQHGLDYDDDFTNLDGSKGAVFIQNSWGSEFGLSASGRDDRGCYWMPYAFFSKPGISNDGTFAVSDCWMMHLGHPW